MRGKTTAVTLSMTVPTGNDRAIHRDVNGQYLDDSVLYNEDDCRATKLIKDWMASGNAEEVGHVI